MRTTCLLILTLTGLTLACGPGAHDAPGDDPVGVGRWAEVAECLAIDDAALLRLPETEEGCSARRALTATNGCVFPVNVTGISLEATGDHLVLVQAPAIPSSGLMVPAGGSISLAVRYQPRTTGSHAGRLVVDVEGSRAVWTLTGSARPMQRITETFTPPEPQRTDLLVVIDNGPLLAPYLEGVRTNLGVWAKFAADASQVRSVGFATTGGSGALGRAELLGGVLDTKSPNFEDDVRRILADLQTRSGLEDPLQVALEVAQKAQPGGPNASLFQEERRTSIVIVTAGSDRSPHNASFYREWLHRLAGGGRNQPWRLSLHVVGGFPLWKGPPGHPDFCGALPDDGRLHWMADWMNGLRDSICSPDWFKTLEGMGVVSFGYRLSFPLTGSPDLFRSKLEVGIDGESVPEIDPRGATVWTFDAVANRLQFEPAYVPEPGQTVEVSYAPRCPGAG